MKCEKCGAEMTVDNNQNAWCIRGCFHPVVNFNPENLDVLKAFNLTEDPNTLKIDLAKDRLRHGSFVMDLWYSPLDAKYSFLSLSAVYDPKKTS